MRLMLVIKQSKIHEIHALDIVWSLDERDTSNSAGRHDTGT